MSNFDLYAHYYDLLYRDKDYEGEAAFIAATIRRFSEGRRVLDLGCGTGQHAWRLGLRGFDITGVDLSSRMIELAEARQRPAGVSIDYQVGDVRTIRLPQKYDAVVSLFHVMSYQTLNADLVSAFTTAKEHLAEDGIFIFDAWYGPAVLTQRPAVRVKRMKNDEIEVMRIAEPTLYPERNVVDVNYSVWITSLIDGQSQCITECHPMRYLFTPEVAGLLDSLGMELIHSSEWMTDDRALDDTTWSALYVAKLKVA